MNPPAPSASGEPASPERPRALRGLRIGCVQYLNSRPLIHKLPGVELAHPSELAGRLRAGAMDAALVPVFELLRSPEVYRVVDGVCIASQGEVYSVFVAHERPLEELESVTADPASLTSIHLFQVLTKGALHRDLPLVSEPPDEVQSKGRGRLLIGNQAIEFRLKHPDGRFSFWDLGDAWARWTGLPFVYAVWVLRADLPDSSDVADAFRKVARSGCAAVEEIAQTQTDFSVDLARRYLGEHIHFVLGAKEKAGLERFSQALEQGGFVGRERAALRFV